MVIVYRKTFLAFGLMLRWIGSALPRALVPATVSTVICALLEAFVPTALLAPFFEHPYPVQVFVYIVAFALVFRTNIAYGRFSEMRLSVTQMSSKWADAAGFALAFEELAVGQERHGADVIDDGPARRSQALLVHRISLMHALALQYLRRDNELRRLCPANDGEMQSFHGELHSKAGEAATLSNRSSSHVWHRHLNLAPRSVQIRAVQSPTRPQP